MAVGLADESSQRCLVAGKIQIAHKVMFMIFPKKCQTKPHKNAANFNSSFEKRMIKIQRKWLRYGIGNLPACACWMVSRKVLLILMV
jgi:hypothetical protein